MEETSNKPGGDAKPAATEQTQSESVEDGHFHPVQLSEQNESDSNSETTENLAEGEQKLQELLRSINEETSQVNDFLMREDKLITELCTSLKEILKRLHISISLPQHDLPLQKRAKKVILNEDAQLAVTSESGEVNSTALRDHSPEMVMAVLWAAIPELAAVVKSQRKKLSARVSLLEMTKKGLKGIASAIFTSPEEKPAANARQSADAAGQTPKAEEKQATGVET